MRRYLLDTNILIALFWPSHERHELAVKWFVEHRGNGWATCPLTQAGFVRITSNPAFSRDAVRPCEAIQVLSANTASKDHEFWPDELPFDRATAFAGVRLLGHQQVTDAYLYGLAIRNGGILATLDKRIATLAASNSAEANALEIVE